MKLFSLVDQAAELLRYTRHSSDPADKILRNYTKDRKTLGSKDRAFLGDVYYHALRHLLRIDEALVSAFEGVPLAQHLAATTGFPINDPAAASMWARPLPLSDAPWSRLDRWIDEARALLASSEVRPEAYADMVPELIAHWPERTIPIAGERMQRHLSRAHDLIASFAADARPVRLGTKHSIPEWLWGQIGFGLSPKEMDVAAAALNQSAPIGLRPNALRTTREEYAAQLVAASLDFRPGTLSAMALVGEKRVAQGKLPGFREGLVVFQDEGSQLISEIIAPQPGDMVLDACAGAGGKTLHCATLMQNRGRILVYDTSAKRLENLFTRANAAGVTIVEVIDPARAAAKPKPEELMDLVLLDVPCTGTGTLRRNPELKWRLTRGLLQRRVQAQRELLERWHRWVKPGGRLAYITCSLLNEENGAQIDAFLAAHPEFAREPLADRPGARPDAILRTGDLQLFPHRHGSDGFYLALLKKS